MAPAAQAQPLASAPAPALAPAPKTRGGSVVLICLRCDSLTDPVSFRADGQRLLATCRDCGSEVQIGELSSAHVTSAEDLRARPFAPPPSYCPKCIAPLGGGATTSCSRCGLDPREVAPDAFGPPTLLAAAWKSLVADWERPDSHAALTRLAERLGCLEGLGRLYQIYLAHRPNDRLARQAREEIHRLVTLGAARPSPSGSHVALA